MTEIMQNFANLVNKAKQEWDSFLKSTQPKIFIGTATCGIAAGALRVLEAVKEYLKKASINASIIEVGCFGLCYYEPLLDIQLPGKPRICFANVTPENAPEIIQSYLVNNKILKEHCIGVFDKKGMDGINSIYEHPMIKPQVRLVLKNCGLIDPTKIEHYLANDGYAGFVKALRLKPEEVIQEIKKSGLRGRGGAGFSAGVKWEICRNAGKDKKYLICNGSEGDPGAFMNQSLIESDPHAVLEGMLIAGYAIGAEEGYIYLGLKSPHTAGRVKIAVSQMRQWGLLGKNILGSDFSFDIIIKEGAGSYVAGEETALIQSIEGQRATPRYRPPFPPVSGLHGKPTVVNNVETLGTLPHILRNGAEWYSQYGTEKSKGTKTFSLTGKIKRPGLIETPFGITLREVIYEIGGGILGDKKLKAVHTGGPSGGCIPADMLDLKIDYEDIATTGSIMGSGGFIVMDETACMVDITHHLLKFNQNESCGKCPPCRIGVRHLCEIVERIKNGEGMLQDLEILEKLAWVIRTGSLCGLGQAAPNSVLMALKYFRHEYEEHILHKRCKVGVCEKLKA